MAGLRIPSTTKYIGAIFQGKVWARVASNRPQKRMGVSRHPLSEAPLRETSSNHYTKYIVISKGDITFLSSLVLLKYRLLGRFIIWLGGKLWERRLKIEVGDTLDEENEFQVTSAIGVLHVDKHPLDKNESSSVCQNPG